MSLRANVLAGAAVGSMLLAAPAEAVTTTSTVVAYIADVDGDSRGELWTRPADGSGTPAKVFSTPNRVWLPALSPDGTLIAYLEDSRSQGDDDFRLFVRPADGTGSATLLSAGDVTGPAWSPDGNKVIFTRINWDTGKYGVYRVDKSGGGSFLVPTTDTLYSEEPSYSPSGRQVAVAYYGTSPTPKGIDLITMSTGNRGRIPGTDYGSDPVWSPDGQHLLFQREISCGVGLYRVPVGGGTPTPIRVVPGYFVGSAEYSRDGSQIFWNETRYRSCNPGTGAGDIWVAAADGSAPAKVAATALYEYSTTVAGGTPAPADTTPPPAPVINPTGGVGSSGARISWPVGGDTGEFVVVRKLHGAAPPASSSESAQVYHGAKHEAATVGLATDTTYDLYLYAIDASGNESPVSAPHTFHTTRAPVMVRIPSVGVPPAGPATAFTVRWTGATTYEVEVGERVRTSTGEWSPVVYRPWLPATAETSKVVTGVQGRSYRFRVRTSDGYGNRTSWSGPTEAHVPLDDRWSGWGYSAGWVSAAASSRYAGTYRYTNAAGATMTSRPVDTRAFYVIADKCPTCGKFDVYVDGKLKSTVDSYGTYTKVRQTLWSTSFASVRPHTIKIVAHGTPGRPRVMVDAIRLTR